MAEQAMDAIRDMIVSGQIRPGEALPAERQLAELLAISRPTLREAISALTAMKILETRHGEGTFVTELGPVVLADPLNFLVRAGNASVSELVHLLRALEVSAVAAAVAHASAADLKALDDAVEQSRRDLEDADGFVKMELRIHGLIVAAAHNPVLAAIAASIAGIVYGGQVLVPTTRQQRDAAHQAHRQIAAALAAGDGDAASGAMQAHLDTIQQAVLRSRN